MVYMILNSKRCKKKLVFNKPFKRIALVHGIELVIYKNIHCGSVREARSLHSSLMLSGTSILSSILDT